MSLSVKHLSIWTDSKKSDVYSVLSPVLKNLNHVDLSVGADLSEFPPHTKLIFGMGQMPVQELGKSGLVQKNRTITSMRGVPVPLKLNGRSVPALLTYSPGIQQVDYAKYVDLLCDAGQAVRFVETGSMEPVLGKYEYVESFQSVIDEINLRYEKTGKPVDMAFDLETIGLDEFAVPTTNHPGAYIVSVQVSITPGTAQVLYFPSRKVEQECLEPSSKSWGELHWLLTTPKVSLRGANAKFDLRWILQRAKIRCTNFKFDTNLVGSLLDENRSNALDVHAKIYTPLGGYCVSPGTKLWTADFKWVTARSVQVDDELVGFDENPEKPGHRRKLRVSKVLSKQYLKLNCYRIKTKLGKELVISANHQWLVGKFKSAGNNGNLVWKRTDEIAVGTRIKSICPVAECENTYDAGWMGGFLDGEGHISTNGRGLTSFALGWSQLPGPVWDKAYSLSGPVWFRQDKQSGVNSSKVNAWRALEILQKFRPLRLLSKRKWEGASLPQEPEWDFVESIEPVGVQTVVSIKTSTATFVAEGLASHNSDSFDRTVDKSRMDLVPKEKLLPYAGGDADATLQVSTAMKTELLANKPLARFYVNILHPAARAFEAIEHGGVWVDMDAYQRLEADLNAEISSLVNKAKEIVGGRIFAKHMDPKKKDGLNLTKASFITDFMFSPMGLNLKPVDFTEKTNAPSTALDHLSKFKGVPEAKEFVSLMQEYGSATKTLSTYVTGFLAHLRSDDKFHPSYKFFVGDRDEKEGGTVTGRLSCKAPAFQTIPKHTKWAKRIRECYPAPPGHVVVEFDYEQGELKVVACIANERTMIEAYQKGLDLHVITSARFAGYSYDEMMAMKKANKEQYDEIRRLGKAGNFGLLYGMSADGFVVYAETSYGVALALEEAAKFRDGFFESYLGLLDYHREYKAFAHQHGYVSSPLGRARHLPLIKSKNRSVVAQAERQAINSPVQSTLSDMMIWAIALSEQQGLDEWMPCFGACHDAAYRYIPEDRLDEGIKKSLEVMESLPFEKVGWRPQLKFTADAKYGPNMAQMTEYK